MKQWKVNFDYIEKINGANISKHVSTMVYAESHLDAHRVVESQYGRDLKNLIITSM